jgi:hypothetical protein
VQDVDVVVCDEKQALPSRKPLQFMREPHLLQLGMAQWLLGCQDDLFPIMQQNARRTLLCMSSHNIYLSEINEDFTFESRQ